MARKEKQLKAQEERATLATRFVQLLRDSFKETRNWEKSVEAASVAFTAEAKKHPQKKTQYEDALLIAVESIKAVYSALSKGENNGNV